MRRFLWRMPQIVGQPILAAACLRPAVLRAKTHVLPEKPPEKAAAGRIACTTILVSLLLSFAASAQPQMVILNLVATDKQGQPITDLKAEDLQVQDDGKPQPIVLFHLNDSKRPAPAALAPHEYANRAPGAAPGATVILFDLLNGSFTDREYTELALVKALSSVESPGNVYLYLLTNSGGIFPIHALPERGADAASPDQNWNAQAKALLDAAIQKVYGLRPIDDRDLAVRAVTTFNMLRDLGSELATLPGRKNVVWVTNGIPIQANFGGLCHNIVIQNVTAPCSGTYVDFTPVVRHLAGQLDAAGVSMYPVNEWNVDGGERILVQNTLDVFAGMTAGRTYQSGGVRTAIPDALQAMRLNYTVAYQPVPKSWDGKYHKIRVTSARKGIQLQSEQAYIAAPPVDETAELMQAAATGNSDLTAIGLRAAVTPGATPNTVRVRLRIDSSNLAIAQQNGRYAGQLGLLYAAITADGPKQLSKPSRLTLDWTAEQYQNALKDGIPITDDLPIPAAVHQVRIVVVDAKSNQVGSLTVPL